LKEYTDIPSDVKAFADKMILSGSNIETVTTFGEEVSGVVIGKVLSVVPHEDSDHLVVCMVDVGSASEDGEPIQIVTGAPNVRVGALIPTALHGSTLPGGVKIKKGKLRGVVSNGMLCSAGELGFEDKVVPVLHKDGIWILPEEFSDLTDIIGEDAVKALGLDETVIDFEITPNRPDCLSILGMAREAAAVFDRPLTLPAFEAEDASTDASPSDHVAVEIRKPALCGRYVARIAKDIVIKESPWWLQRRLMFSGMRPINSIVDITNYVMLELGHPIHAFDIRTIAQGKILVDTAKEGEKFTTLDGTERTLAADMLLINDGEKGIAIAGVMGGLNSEIEADTKAILIEAANFNSDSIRLTSKRLGIRTEASARYEKGVSAELSADAAGRVCALISETGSGKILAGAVDNFPGKREPIAIDVRTARMNKLLGTGLSQEDMEGFLRRLGMTVVSEQGLLHVTPPHVRLDLKEEVDFSEEIGRIYGYDNLEVTLHKDNVEAGKSMRWALRDVTRDVLTGMGIDETQTYSFVSPKGVDKIRLPQDSEARHFVKLINPLGEENSVMRTLLLPNLIEALALNTHRSNAQAALFEVGNTFRATDAAADALPAERVHLSIGAYGEGWDFFALKGVIEGLLSRLGISNASFEPEENSGCWHPGRCARILIPAGLEDATDAHSASASAETSAALELGLFGELHPDAAAAYDIDEPVYAAELDLDALIEISDLLRHYEPLDKYPAVTRDISLLASEDVTVGRVTSIVTANGGSILESVKLFDVYRGQQIPEGMKSLSFNLVYRASDRTLTDADVAKVHEKILSELSTGTGATLREI
jgi:phenylalanyl-tRNA synthetase beta chain